MHNEYWIIPQPALARSAHRGRFKLLREYVSDSSTALNPLTITQLACELVRSCTALGGPCPTPSISCVHVYNNYHAPKQPASNRAEGFHFIKFDNAAIFGDSKSI